MNSIKHIIFFFIIMYRLEPLCISQEYFPDDPVYFELGSGKNDVQGVFEINLKTPKRIGKSLEYTLHGKSLEYTLHRSKARRRRAKK